MKKIIISMMLALVAVTASAQIKTVDIKGNLRSDFGLGIGITGDLSITTLSRIALVSSWRQTSTIISPSEAVSSSIRS